MAKLLTLQFSRFFLLKLVLVLFFKNLILPAERSRFSKNKKKQQTIKKVAKLLTYGGQFIDPTAYIYITTWLSHKHTRTYTCIARYIAICSHMCIYIYTHSASGPPLGPSWVLGGPGYAPPKPHQPKIDQNMGRILLQNKKSQNMQHQNHNCWVYDWVNLAHFYSVCWAHQKGPNIGNTQRRSVAHPPRELPL